MLLVVIVGTMTFRNEINMQFNKITLTTEIKWAFLIKMPQLEGLISCLTSRIKISCSSVLEAMILLSEVN